MIAILMTLLICKGLMFVSKQIGLHRGWRHHAERVEDVFIRHWVAPTIDTLPHPKI